MGMGSESTADDDAEEVGFNSYNPSSTEMDGMKRIGSGLKHTTWQKIGHFVDLLPSEHEGTFIAMLCFFCQIFEGEKVVYSEKHSYNRLRLIPSPPLGWKK